MGIRVVSSPTNKLMGIVSHLVLDEEGENIITQTMKKSDFIVAFHQSASANFASMAAVKSS